MQQLPGTELPVEDISIGFAKIAPSLEATGGLTLAQVCSITGLEQSTLQNWIKRGWVAHPIGKRYGEYQLARIMIINMLRPSMLLENIAYLLRYVNGEADNRGDDILPDSILYTHLCKIISECASTEAHRPEHIRQIVDKYTANHSEKNTGEREKLANALTVMAVGYIAAEMTKQANTMFNDLFYGK